MVISFAKFEAVADPSFTSGVHSYWTSKGLTILKTIAGSYNTNSVKSRTMFIGEMMVGFKAVNLNSKMTSSLPNKKSDTPPSSTYLTTMTVSGFHIDVTIVCCAVVRILSTMTTLEKSALVYRKDTVNRETP